METSTTASYNFGIPQLAPISAENLPSQLIPYGQRCQPLDEIDAAIHFFLDDARFECIWNRPKQALKTLSQYDFVLTPDFSLYRNMSLAEQIWNTYRSRWCGAFWQQHGLQVIPTISWSSAESYVFCFQGLPTRSLVAVSTVGVALNKPLERYLFIAGFEEMVRRLEPSIVLCYGRLPNECRKSAEIHEYPTRWDKIRDPQEVA